MTGHRHDIPAHFDEDMGWQDLTIHNLAMDASQLRRDRPRLTLVQRNRLHATMADISYLLGERQQ